MILFLFVFNDGVWLFTSGNEGSDKTKVNLTYGLYIWCDRLGFNLSNFTKNETFRDNAIVMLLVGWFGALVDER